MIKQEDDKFIRINKTKAKNLFAKGVNVYMMGNKTRLVHNMWIKPVEMNKNETFDVNVGQFYYYMDSQLGNDVAFYMEKNKVEIHEGPIYNLTEEGLQKEKETETFE